MPPKSLPWPWNSMLADNQPKSGDLVGFSDAARSRHGVIFGGSGVGKSRFLESLVVLDAIRRVTGRSKRGVVVLDVHGDLCRNIRARLAIATRQFPELNELLVFVDPTIKNWTVGLNPLEIRDDAVAERIASGLADTVATIYRESAETTPRLYRIASNTFLALALAGKTLTDLPCFLTDRLYREQMVSRLNHPELTQFWFSEFPKAGKQGDEREALAMTESTLNRLTRFITDPDIAALFSGSSTINWRDVLDTGKIVLVSAPVGILGSGNSYLLCALILSAIEQAALSRADVPEDRRTPVTVYADEFVRYVTSSITQIIAEGRKFGIELILATQETKGHLRNVELQSAVLNTVGNIMTFRLGYSDAETLVKDIFAPDLNAVKDVHYRWQKPLGIDVLYREKVYRALPEIWETEIRKITQLPDQMMWYKRRGHPGSQLIKTLSVADIRKLPNAHELAQLLEAQEITVARRTGRVKLPRIQVQPVQRNSSPVIPKLLGSGKDEIDESEWEPIE